MYRFFGTCWAGIALATLLPSAIANSSEAGDFRAGRISSRWTPQEWTYTVQYSNISNYADRPDESTLNSLSVEWREPELDELGNQCTIRGRMLVNDNDNGEGLIRPFDWFQGITIYLGMNPEAKPDWSKGMDQADTLHATAITSHDGSFEARVDMRESKRDRSQAQMFQFGVALAEQSGDDKSKQELVWSSRTPVLPSSIEMLTVPAAPELSRELALIDRASGWPFSNPNGLDLIHAVNALQALGKDRALAVLEQYLTLTQEPRQWSDQEIVFWIVRLLFEPVRLGDRIPRPGIAVFVDDREVPEAMKWPLNPMAVEGDVPFMVGHRIGMAGMPEHPSSHIHWARLHGVLRDQPLIPTENPLSAAEAILKSRRFKALEEHSRREGTQAIRSQALAMVEGLVEPVGERNRIDINDAQWKSRLEAAAEADLQWDAQREEFVAVSKR
jgi:hypothetical protein